MCQHAMTKTAFCFYSFAMRSATVIVQSGRKRTTVMDTGRNPKEGRARELTGCAVPDRHGRGFLCLTHARWDRPGRRRSQGAQTCFDGGMKRSRRKEDFCRIGWFNDMTPRCRTAQMSIDKNLGSRTIQATTLQRNTPGGIGMNSQRDGFLIAHATAAPTVGTDSIHDTLRSVRTETYPGDQDL